MLLPFPPRGPLPPPLVARAPAPPSPLAPAPRAPLLRGGREPHFPGGCGGGSRVLSGSRRLRAKGGSPGAPPRRYPSLAPPDCRLSGSLGLINPRPHFPRGHRLPRLGGYCENSLRPQLLSGQSWAGLVTHPRLLNPGPGYVSAPRLRQRFLPRPGSSTDRYRSFFRLEMDLLTCPYAPGT